MEPGRAVGVLEEAAAAYPEVTDVYLALGDAYAGVFDDPGPEGDAAKAEAWYRRGLAAAAREYARTVFAERLEELAGRGAEEEVEGRA